MPCRYNILISLWGRKMLSVVVPSAAVRVSEGCGAGPRAWKGKGSPDASIPGKLIYTSVVPSPSEQATTATTAVAATAKDRATQLERLWRLPAKPPHIPATVWNGLLRGLHLSDDNPVGITARLVDSFFRQEGRGPLFSLVYPAPQPTIGRQHRAVQTKQQQHQAMQLQMQQHGSTEQQQLQHDDRDPFIYVDRLSPIVSVRENFDSLLIGAHHSSRSTSDTYYLDPAFSLSHAQLAALTDGDCGHSISAKHIATSSSSGGTNPASNSSSNTTREVIRTHGTAHQAAVLGCGLRRAVWSGAVARRDQVDSTHYPVFHQIDGICIFDAKDTTSDGESEVLETLKQQHAALLQAVDLAKQLEGQAEHQGRTHGTELSLRAALVEACAAAGLPDASMTALCSFACLGEANPHRNNPIVLQLQMTLERLVRFLWAHKPGGIATQIPTPHGSSRDPSATNSNSSSSNNSSTHPAHATSELSLRWVYDAYFPFTSPSLELEVFHEGKWLEVLGAGEIQPEIIANACAEQQQQDERHCELLQYVPPKWRNKALNATARGWAFGLGIERVAMVLFSIGDIRQLWSEDPRFAQQYRDGLVKAFVPFSYMPPVFKDLSFWLPIEPDANHSTDCMTDTSAPPTGQTERLATGGHNSTQSSMCPPAFDLSRFYEVCREEGSALIESVVLQDVFTHPRTGRKSLCFRFTYKALDRTLTHPEVNAIQDKLVSKLKEAFAIELR